MAKYLLEGNYVGDGRKGLLTDGGAARRAAIVELAESLGGSVESIYYAFGDVDLYVIVELPDQASVAAFGLLAGASGSVTIKTTVLVDPEEIDVAASASKDATFTPPGEASDDSKE